MANLGLQNNNPGNLRNPSTGNFQQFSNAGDGYNALMGDLQYKQQGKSKHIQPGGTLLDLANVWAPASDNNIPENWAKNVARTVGTDINARWDTIPLDTLAKGIMVAEGTSTMSVAPQGNLASNSGSTGRMSKEDFGKKIKAKYPQYASLDDRELADKIIAKYPQYKDSVQNTGVLETTPGTSMGEKIVDNTATQYVADKFTDGTVGKWAGKAYHSLVDPLVDVSAMPVQLLAKGASKLTGTEYKDPYKKMPGNFNVNEITDVKGKAGSTLESALMFAPLIPKALAGAKATRMLKNPAILESLPNGMTEKAFLSLGKTEQANILGDLLKSASSAGMAGDAAILSNAIKTLTTKTPGLISKILGGVTGGRIGITDALGMKEAWELLKKYVK
jgi:hypothetical protein